MARPSKKFTDEQVKVIADYAFHGCQNNTIATLLDIPVNTLTRHFGKLLTKKRCERKLYLRKAQDRKAGEGDTGMLCFLGKNELGQSDKQEITHGVTTETAKLLRIIDGSNKGKLPDRQEAKDVE